jgi:hypothetical protein
MKHYYSIVANSKDDVVLPEYLIAVGCGVNVFTVTTDDLPGVLSRLAQEGVQVQTIHQLDGTEAFHQLPNSSQVTLSLGEGPT